MGGRVSSWMVVVGSLLLAACCLPPVASAEVRVANALNAKRSDPGTPIRPVLDGLSARYDDVAGDITLILTFFEPLAQQDALGGWDLSIYLADNVGTDAAPVCIPLLSHHNFLFTVLLGSEQRAEAIQYGGRTYRFAWRISADRRTVRIRGASPAFAGMRLMCAHADLSGPRGEYSFIGAQLFSGYTPLDGNLETTGRWALSDEIAQLNNRIGKRRRDRDPPLSRWPNCRRTGRAQLRCSARDRLLDIKGRPTITVNGRMTVSYGRSLRTRWRRDMRATLRWRRCPGSVSPGRAGRRCAVSRRWGRGELSEVFRSVLRARRPRASEAEGLSPRTDPSSVIGRAAAHAARPYATE